MQRVDGLETLFLLYVTIALPMILTNKHKKSFGMSLCTELIRFEH